MADLITQDYLSGCLSAAGLAPTAGQAAVLPRLTSAASRAIRKWCHRYFNRRTSIDELYTVEPGRPVLLNEFPVNSIDRAASSPTTVLTITNGGASNQRATVKLATSGDADGGLTVTGLTLWRIASGTAATDTVDFGAGDTVQAAADAVNALAAGGWSASADPGYRLWPAADLRAVQGALPARGVSAELKIHVEDLAFELEPDAGLLHLAGGSGDDPFGLRWGVPLSADLGDPDVRGATNGLRVVYDAGFDVVPEDVQQACAEAVIDMMRLLAINPRLQSETLGSYSYSLGTALAEYALPKPAMARLAPYRSVRA
jgi:hypothetical protein